MAGERKRIEDIKRRKALREKARRRKIYMIRRCALLLIAAGIIIAAVLGIRSCVSSMAQKRAEEEARLAAEEAARIAAMPTPTPEPVYSKKGINLTYYDNSAFVGNSFIEGMEIYELAENIDYFTKVGLNVSQALTEATDMGTVPVIDELKSDKKYNRIFMMFGENEVGWIGNSFFEQYEQLIAKAKQYQPQAKIYLLAITAISKNMSDQNIDGLNIDAIKSYNAGIADLAERTGSIYADLYSVTAAPDGYLPANAATDGVHFGEDYYIKCLKYIQDNCE